MVRGSITDSPIAADPRLQDARRAFEEARLALEEARAHLLRTHTETSRLWGAGS